MKDIEVGSLPKSPPVKGAAASIKHHSIGRELLDFKKFEWKDSERWNEFCLQNDFAWFWHTSWRLKHALHCSFSISSTNHSFFMEDKSGTIIAIAPLTVDETQSNDSEAPVCTEMNYGGGMVPFPVVSQNVSQRKNT